MSPWNDQKDPGKAHTAHSAQGDQSGEQYVADSAQGSGEYLDEYKDDIAGRDIAQHIYPDDHNVHICRKYMEQRTTEDHQEGQQEPAHAKRHCEADADALEYPVISSGAIILSGECCDRDAESPAHSPEDCINLPVCGPCRRGIRAKAVYGGLDDDIGDSVHAGL